MTTNLKSVLLLFGLLSILRIGYADPQGHSAAQHSVAVNDTTRKPEVLIRVIPSVDTSYVSMLKPPASQKLRSGFVCIQPGNAGEEHSTEGYEEMIVILNGQAELQHSDQHLSVGVGNIAYIPPHTKHYLKNAGSETLRYLYIVTKVEP